ncbi:MAG: hypothetical protein IJS22_03245 [Lachnospiraceae bacterium]|nr:hypothetical protein [Lachnospiraceae bacterium]
MEFINGDFFMKGLDTGDPSAVTTWQELVEKIGQIGFLPFFSGEIEGFSVEEMTCSANWWSGDADSDPWEWREIIAADHRVAYGKFFDKKAGFISLEWLPYFANFRRDGYDFDARWDDGMANRREKKIMDFYISEDKRGDTVYSHELILSTELKHMAGFGNGGEKNFPGILTGLQMQTYLVISQFQRRESKGGSEYGMPVSVMLTPEAIWGREAVTSAYGESVRTSWERISNRIKDFYPHAKEKDIIKLIGKV